MKKITLAISAILVALSLNAQIAITIEGTTTDISGQTHFINTTSNSENIIDFLVENQSSESQDWVVTRERINVVAPEWTDYLCWGAEGDPFGTCYSFDIDNPWTTGQSLNVAPSMKGLLAIHITPNLSASEYAHYRYFIGRTADSPSDSVDIVFNQLADLKGKEFNNQPFVTFSPNPCDKYLYISTSNNTENVLKVFDALGNELHCQKFIGELTLNTDMFKNGVYFFNISSLSGINKVQRIIIKH